MSETVTLPGISIQSTIPESDMVLKISQAQRCYFDGNNRQVIKEVTIFVDYEWFKGGPVINKEDGITVNWDSGLFTFKQDSFHSTDYKAYSSNGSWRETNSQINPAEISQGGLGYIAYLNLGNTAMGEGIPTYGAKGFAYFTILPKSRIYSGNSYNTSINAQYTHNKNLLNTIGFSVSGMTVTVSLSGQYDSVGKSVTFSYSK